MIEKGKIGMLFKYRIYFILAMVFLLFLKPAHADEDDKLEQKRKELSSVSLNKKSPQTLPDSLKRFNFYLYAGAVEGYDNNVFLNPARKGDLFDQAMLDVVAKYRITDNLNFKSSYNITSITYHEFTTLSMLNNDLAVSFEYYPTKNIKIESGYDLYLADYLNNKEADVDSNGPFALVKYFINKNSYIGARYSFGQYQYERNIRDASNNTSSIEREDHRHAVTAEGGTYIGDLFLKVKNRYYFNESNDGYMDFYDYQANKTMAYASYPIIDKLSLNLKAGYKRKEYKSRTITTDSTKEEHDDLLLLGVGLYYELNKNLYLNANCNYRQNYSNDPIQEYSGTVSSVGISYTF